MKTSQKRKYEELFFIRSMQLSTILVVTFMGLIIYTILKKGIPALNWEIISSTPKGGFYFGGEGGILNAIIGSLYLAVGSSLMALAISLPAALYINIHLKKHKKIQDGIRMLIDVLWGIPSVVYGAFAFSVMIYLGIRTSLLAGIITVALFIIPIMLRGMDEVLKTVPHRLYESSFSLGSTKFETAFYVYIKQCLPGIITAFLLSFGRAIGDAAAVLFTTGYTDNIPRSLSQPTATLPLSIFFQLSSPLESVKERAYASAIVLTMIIFIISIIGRIIFYKYSKTRIN